jgi:hypothetical protein
VPSAPRSRWSAGQPARHQSSSICQPMRESLFGSGVKRSRTPQFKESVEEEISNDELL